MFVCVYCKVCGICEMLIVICARMDILMSVIYSVRYIQQTSVYFGVCMSTSEVESKKKR